DAIRAESVVAVTELKKTAEADVASIKDWSRAELARVREETEARINARRAQLVEETEAAGRAAEDLLGRLHTTREAFDADMVRFFETLLAEEDPARLAGLAERMPSPPDLTAFPALDAWPTDELPVPEADGTVADAVPEGGATTEASAGAPEPPMPHELPTGQAGDDVAVPDAASQQPLDARAAWLDHLAQDAAAEAEAEALAGLDRQTSLIVAGLSSVAGIAAFKGALVHAEGVNAVSVTAGSNGDVLFTVTHDRQTELRDVVRGLEAFEPHLIADDGDTLSVTAREPAA
ncbi:MAG TPA: hypothetical protein VET90_08395, partial [Candidatus Binatus sp.]|nr:hypothetical protein [Candidatus Binatus sp.]